MITGTTTSPKYSVDSSYLKEKLNNQITKGIDKILGNDSKKTDTTNQNSANTGTNSNDPKAASKARKEQRKEAVKDLLKGLF